MMSRIGGALGAAAALLAFASQVNAAETVFRCGNSYSQTPCSHGRAIDVDDSRSDAQQAAARAVAARDAKLAAQMTSDRERAEAANLVKSAKRVRNKSSAGPVALSAPSTTGSTRKSRRIGTEDFVAVSPRPAKQSVAKQ